PGSARATRSSVMRYFERAGGGEDLQRSADSRDRARLPRVLSPVALVCQDPDLLEGRRLYLGRGRSSTLKRAIGLSKGSRRASRSPPRSRRGRPLGQRAGVAPPRRATTAGGGTGAASPRR